jgi:hypothetical protein
MVIKFTNHFSACCPADCPFKSNTDGDVFTTTPKAGTAPINFDEKMKEITICFDFQPKNSKAARKASSVIHTHLLPSKMTEAFTDDLLMFNNKGNVVKNINPI